MKERYFRTVLIITRVDFLSQLFVLLQSSVDPIYAQQWEMLALLCELFSRVLLTTGDDEFFEDGKNPLNLDEIIKMSACLRVRLRSVRCRNYYQKIKLMIISLLNVFRMSRLHYIGIRISKWKVFSKAHVYNLHI